jgi:hypothetical protein
VDASKARSRIKGGTAAGASAPPLGGVLTIGGEPDPGGVNGGEGAGSSSGAAVPRPCPRRQRTAELVGAPVAGEAHMMLDAQRRREPDAVVLSSAEEAGSAPISARARAAIARRCSAVAPLLTALGMRRPSSSMRFRQVRKVLPGTLYSHAMAAASGALAARREASSTAEMAARVCCVGRR